MKIERSNFLRYIGRINYIAIIIIGIFTLSSGVYILFGNSNFEKVEFKYFASVIAIIVGAAITYVGINIRKEFEDKINRSDL
ncbi:MAG: hypothetical protein ED556_06070 [Winogradskyella sp.]|uniref:hypothetical protein n=1 Tax=Winogradskyella sp. TaxID=1883156 RepID=UPI000F3AF834|nr:hypothetical protein [Winogradskyella sp.]RNC86987.1 MAG: hypothetical protein ED556_06070 [Winogradskyella sp.]